MDEYVLPSKLLSILYSAADVIREQDFIHIFSHHDADGVSAACILACALDRLGKEYQVTFIPVLNDDTFQIMKESLSKCLLLSDVGAAYIPKFEELDKQFVVLDHHKTEFNTEKFPYANPHLYGIDGMTSGCGATMSLLFAVILDENNWDLAQIAFAGIAGDRQHIKGLSGLNTYVEQQSTKRGFVKVIDGSLIPSGHLSQSLYLSTDPYIRGVSGDMEGVNKILQEAGVSNDKNFIDLSDDEKWKLSSLIAIKLAKQGVILDTLNEVSRKRYYLSNYNMDAEMMADLMNACGRMDLGGVAIGLSMGSKDALLRAMDLNGNSKNKIVEAVSELDKKGLNEMEHIQHFDSSASGFTGIICGVVMNYVGDPSKPTIGIGDSDGISKCSSRGMWEQLDRGINLAAAMREAAKSVDGEGGGHMIASGATFKSERKNEFLANLDRIVGEQLLSRAK